MEKKTKKINPPHWRVGATLFTPSPKGHLNPKDQFPQRPFKNFD